MVVAVEPEREEEWVEQAVVAVAPCVEENVRDAKAVPAVASG